MGLAVDLIFQLFAIPHLLTFDPITGEDSPRDETKRVPPKVDKESLGVPEVLPPVRVCYRHFELSGQLDPRTRAASSSFRALKREHVGKKWD